MSWIFFPPSKISHNIFAELNQLTGLVAILRFPMQELVHYEWLLKRFLRQIHLHPHCSPLDNCQIKVLCPENIFPPSKISHNIFAELNQLTGLATILHFPMQELVHYEWLLKRFCDTFALHPHCPPHDNLPNQCIMPLKIDLLSPLKNFPQYLCRTQSVDGPGRPPPLSNAGHRGRRQLRLGRRLKQELVHLRNLYLLLTLPVLSAKKLL